MAAVIPPLCYHRVFSNAAHTYERITLLFNEEFLPHEIRAEFLEQTRRSPVSGPSALAPVLTALGQTMAAADLDHSSPLIEGLLAQLFYLLIDGLQPP